MDSLPGPESATTTRKHLSADQVVEVLARCFAKRPNYPTPDEGAVYWLTRRINQYIDNPWDDASIAELRDRAKIERDEAAALRDAANIVRRDLAGWRELLPRFQPGSMMHVAGERMIADLETTIATLERQRGDLNGPGLTIRLSDGSKAPKPWALMAAGIADELFRVLHDSGDPRQGLGGADGPITKCLAIFLRLIISPEKVPKRSTIHEAVENHLVPSLKYRLGGY